MSIVIDASMAMAWSFQDEQTPESMRILEIVGDQGAVVPSLWKLEVANSLRSAIRRGRADHAYRTVILAQLSALPIEIDLQTAEQAWGLTLDIADAQGLTPYDASYIELAQRRRVPLATLDRRLATAAAAQGMQLL
jgi:predicted nucleic acid-binding protein